MRRPLSFVLLAMALAGCTIEPIRPEGTWAVTLTYGQGNCGLGGTQEFLTFSVIPDGNGFQLSGAQATGQINCSPDRCIMDLQGSNDIVVNGIHAVFGIAARLFLDDEDSITGSGNILIGSESGTCSQAFSANGQRL